MKVLFAFVGVSLFMGGLAVLDSRTPVLSTAECLAVEGSLEDYACLSVATCEQGLSLYSCYPAYGCDSGCFDCEAVTSYESCVVSAGHSCTDSGWNDCGHKRVGFCMGEPCSCGNTVWYGPMCGSVPHCTGS